MPVRENREYRAMSTFDIVPSESDEKRYLVEGYASTFDIYDLFEDEGIVYKEKVDRDAYVGTDMTDVVLLKDHAGTVFGRTKNDTVELSVDDHGLHVRADMSKTKSSREAFEEIESGMYTQMSFGFTVDDDEYDQRTHTRIIKHIKKLFDVSFVSFPANYYTDIAVATRSRFDGFINEEKAERLRKEQRLAVAIAKFNFMEV